MILSFPSTEELIMRKYFVCLWQLEAPREIWRAVSRSISLVVGNFIISNLLWGFYFSCVCLYVCAWSFFLKSKLSLKHLSLSTALKEVPEPVSPTETNNPCLPSFKNNFFLLDSTTFICGKCFLSKLSVFTNKLTKKTGLFYIRNTGTISSSLVNWSWSESWGTKWISRSVLISVEICICIDV